VLDGGVVAWEAAGLLAAQTLASIIVRSDGGGTRPGIAGGAHEADRRAGGPESRLRHKVADAREHRARARKLKASKAGYKAARLRSRSRPASFALDRQSAPSLLAAQTSTRECESARGAPELHRASQEAARLRLMDMLAMDDDHSCRPDLGALLRFDRCGDELGRRPVRRPSQRPTCPRPSTSSNSMRSRSSPRGLLELHARLDRADELGELRHGRRGDLLIGGWSKVTRQ
jgi:hypothetical protein